MKAEDLRLLLNDVGAFLGHGRGKPVLLIEGLRSALRDNFAEVGVLRGELEAVTQQRNEVGQEAERCKRELNELRRLVRGQTENLMFAASSQIPDIIRALQAATRGRPAAPEEDPR